MRKGLVLFVIALLFLAGCNKVHENINQSMADDTEQVLTIIETNMKEDRDLTERETATMDDYLLLYGAKEKSDKLTEEENRLFILTRNLIEMYERSSALSSDKDSYNDAIKRIRTVIKTGSI